MDLTFGIVCLFHVKRKESCKTYKSIFLNLYWHEKKMYKEKYKWPINKFLNWFLKNITKETNNADQIGQNNKYVLTGNLSLSRISMFPLLPPIHVMYHPPQWFPKGIYDSVLRKLSKIFRRIHIKRHSLPRCLQLRLVGHWRSALKWLTKHMCLPFFLPVKPIK